MLPMQYPIGIQDFKSIIQDGFVYVDKTDLVYQLVKTKGVYFISRPRRFGKSLLVSTIKYYFEGRRDLFRGLRMEQLEEEWQEYPVFEIDFNGAKFVDPGTLHKALDDFVTEGEQRYGRSDKQLLGDRFADLLRKAHEQTGRRCVVLIDEYDKPLLDVMDSGARFHKNGQDVLIEDDNREELKAFFSTFKKADADLRFVFLTGVTKFAQVSVFSGVNNARDMSMNPAYDAICGITCEELESVFRQSINDMARASGVSYGEMLDELQQAYDGYHFSEEMTDIFNPFSLLNAFADRKVKSYWFATGTPTYLVRLLGHSKENLEDIVRREYRPEEFIDYRATVESPVPMIYQSGYLTIKGFDRRRNRYRLDLPNKEVSDGFLGLEAANYFGDGSGRTRSWVDDAAIALEDGKIDEFHNMLVDFVASIPFNVRKDNSEKSYEKEFHFTVFLLTRLIASRKMIVLNELPSSNGIADLVIETPGFVYIFEFKLDHPAAEALRQIADRGYAAPYAHDKRKVYCVGCSFSSTTGRISDWATWVNA